MFWLSKQYSAVERVCFISRWPKCSLWVCVKFYCSVLFLSLCRLTNRCLILRFRNISYVHTITSIFIPLTWFRGDAWQLVKNQSFTNLWPSNIVTYVACSVQFSQPANKNLAISMVDDAWRHSKRGYFLENHWI